MFTTNKRLKELDVKLDEIKKEKAELLKIKEILEDTTPKIDISNGYVLEKGKIYYLVYKQVKKINGVNCFRVPLNGYESTLIDIFSKKIVLKKQSIEQIYRNDVIYEDINDLDAHYSIKLIPICEIESNLLAYPNKQVPEYVLIKLYYKLNKIDINAKILKKEKI